MFVGYIALIVVCCLALAAACCLMFVVVLDESSALCCMLLLFGICSLFASCCYIDDVFGFMNPMCCLSLCCGWLCVVCIACCLSRVLSRVCFCVLFVIGCAVLRIDCCLSFVCLLFVVVFAIWCGSLCLGCCLLLIGCSHEFLAVAGVRCVLSGVVCRRVFPCRLLLFVEY